MPAFAIFFAATVTPAARLMMRAEPRVDQLMPTTLRRPLERIVRIRLAVVAAEFIAGGIRDMLHPA